MRTATEVFNSERMTTTRLDAQLDEILRKPQATWTDDEARIVAAWQESRRPLHNTRHDDP